MAKLTQVMTMTIVPMEDPHRTTFIWMNQQEDMVVHIAIPLSHVNFGTIMAPDFEMQEVSLGKPTKETTKALTNMGLKNVFK